MNPHEPVVDGMATLATAIGRVARSDGDYVTTAPGVTFHRRRAATAPMHCIYGLGLGITAQGEKQVTLGDKVLRFGPGQSLLTTVDLPVISHVTRASQGEPFLGVMLALDAQEVRQMAGRMKLPPPPRDCAYQPMAVESLDAALLDAVLRLVTLIDDPILSSQLAPLIRQEIIVRLLSGPHGLQLQHLAADGAPSQQIARSIAWLKQNFAEPLRVDDLATSAHMSPSTFRLHFRGVTGMSPLQYQKQLRLQQARQLMLTQNLDAGATAGRVGYESASQFSREYSRLFGEPPQRDIRRLRMH